MLAKRFSFLAVTMLLVSGVGFFTTAEPAVTITSPANGSEFTTNELNVTGKSLGSDGYWNQSSQADFVNGTGKDLAIGTDGTVCLNYTTYDNFDDNSIDTNKWQTSSLEGVSVSEKNGALHIDGTSQSSSVGGAEGMVFSKAYASTNISADLTGLSGSGNGYITRIGFYQDSGNLAELHIRHMGDPYASTDLSIFWFDQGSGSIQTFAHLGPGAHTVGVEYIDGTVSAFYDGVDIGSEPVVLSNYVCQIAACAISYGDTVSAVWDNVKIGYALSANYTSAVFDTGCTDPALESVNWTAATPSGTGVNVEVRSSAKKDMSSSTAWTAVGNGDGSSLPTVKRYIQYMAQLSSSDGFKTPALEYISVKFYKPVARVDVSIDNKMTWLAANGTADWYIVLALPEDSTQIWVKATDEVGMINVTSVRVVVDTTPPTGSIMINDNAPFTLVRDVGLGLNASDRYGVVSMMVSEDPDFTQASWEDFAENADLTLSSGDGPKTIYVKFKDSHGLESEVYNATIILDTLPPAGSVLIDGGATYTRNSTVVLAIEASDLNGVQSMMIGTTTDLQGAQWRDYESTATFPLAPGSGHRTVFIKFRDGGGHVSQVYSDDIMMDQQAPTVAVVIDGGAAYTRYTNATATLAAVEDYEVEGMQAGPVDSNGLTLLPWEAFRASINLTLPPNDGTKTVSARLQDAAGNIGAASSATIILDTTAPKTTVGALPASTTKAAIPVSWSASDSGSGVLSYDVQYKTRNGTWTDWLLRTSLTGAVFTGADLETYSFRARAQDMAGNLEEYPANVNNAVSVILPEPVVSCISPKQDAKVSGVIIVNGTCQIIAGGRNVTQVEIRVDNGTWQKTDGLLSWRTQVDTLSYPDGQHTIQVRTFDGKNYSKPVQVTFTVKNAKAKGASGADGALILLCALGAAVIMSVWKKRNGRSG